MTTINAALVEDLVSQIDKDLDKDGRLGKVRRYLAGDHDLPYMPKGAKKEYKRLAEQSITNWCPLLSATFAQGLYVDGYRDAKAAENSAAWAWWQANGLDARQSIVHRGALEYGTSYVVVLPGTLNGQSVPFIRPVSPLRAVAWYADDDDEFPEVFLRLAGTSVSGERIVEVIDSTTVYTWKSAEGADWSLAEQRSHGVGICPVVRFRDRLDDVSVGVIQPHIQLQDRINNITFSTLIAIQYASHRQRWATGLAIPEDEDGNPVEPFESAVDRLWVSEDENARFGDFAQTELSGHLAASTDAVRTLAATAQISPNILTGDLVNLSAEALAQLESSTQRRREEYETIFGEAWEAVFKLASRVAGESDNTTADASQVRWRDTEARSLAATVDALGKMAQMLQVPVEALWEQIPGVTDQDVTRWKALRESSDVLGALMGDFQRQTAPSPSPAPATNTAPAAEAA